MTSDPRASFWERYWFGEASLVRLAALRIILLAATLFGVLRFTHGVLQGADGADFAFLSNQWRPIYAFEMLHIGPMGPELARVVLIVLLAAIAFGILGLFTRTACALAAVLTFLWVGTLYSYGKPHHDFVVLMFGLLALPLGPVGARISIDSLRRRLRRARDGGDPLEVPSHAPLAALPVHVVQLTAVLGYFFAGATKLIASGPAWINGYSLQGHMLAFDSPWTEYFASNSEVCRLMSVGLIAIQATFPLILLGGALRWLYLPGAVAFHLIAMQTMETGSFLTLWFTLAAFISLEKLPYYWVNSVGAGKLRWRILRWSAWVLGALGIGLIYFRIVPLYLVVCVLPLGLAAGLALIGGMELELAYDRTSARARRRVAWVAALDWTDRVLILDEEKSTEVLAGRELAVLDHKGRRSLDGDALRTLVWRLPLTLPLAPLWWRP
jgi:hypothetical protein